jgi:hypothetical protein
MTPIQLPSKQALKESRAEWTAHKHIRPLLGPHHIYYVAFPSTTDHLRFIRVFRDTWRRLPHWPRRKLVAEWRNYLMPPPTVEVTNVWRMMDGKTWGSWHPPSPGSAHLFHFWSNAVNAMPDEILSILIAHELAHPVMRLMWRGWYPERFYPGTLLILPEWMPPEEEKGSIFDEEESDTRELQDEWGFSEDLLCEWEAENAARLMAKHEAENRALEAEYGEEMAKLQ